MGSSLETLFVFAGELLAGRRLLYIGTISEEHIDRLLTLGARAIHAFSHGTGSNAGKSWPRGVTVAPLRPDFEFGVRDGAFDVAIVEDIYRVPNAQDLVAALRKTLSNDGVLIAAADPAKVQSEGEYFDFYDLLSLQFQNVRMFGRRPIGGVAIAELGLEEVPGVALDQQLVEDEGPPDSYFALASHRDKEVESFLIVQVPQPVVVNTPSLTNEPPIPKVSLPSAMSAPTQDPAMLSRITELEHALKAAEATVREREEAIERVQRELREMNSTSKSFESAVQRAEKAEGQVQTLEKALEEARKRAAEFELKSEEVHRKLVAQEKTMLRLEESAKTASHRDLGEIERFEALLRDQAQTIDAQRFEIEKRGRIVDELVKATQWEKIYPQRVISLEAQEDIERMKKKVDTMSFDIAKRESEIQANAWRIAELSDEISRLRGARS